MVKTTLAVPTTSVFLELDCGYWSPEAEAKMREKMKEVNLEGKTPSNGRREDPAALPSNQ